MWRNKNGPNILFVAYFFRTLVLTLLKVPLLLRQKAKDIIHQLLFLLEKTQTALFCIYRFGF